MYGNETFVTGSEFNRFSNLDNLEWGIINYLVNSQTKYANNLWKILAYDTEDCLLKSEVQKEQRLNLIYTNNGDASVKRVFITPYIDDAWVEQSSHLHIYVSGLTPQNHLLSSVEIGIETIVHNKISNILGEAMDLETLRAVREDEEKAGDEILTSWLSTNPVELDEEGNLVVPYKNRATVMLKSVLADLNGAFIKGIGVLQFNSQLNTLDVSKQKLWNSRNFYGHSTVMSTLIAGDSSVSGCGY